jgi:hypothetical protein
MGFGVSNQRCDVVGGEERICKDLWRGETWWGQ